MFVSRFVCMFRPLHAGTQILLIVYTENKSDSRNIHTYLIPRLFTPDDLIYFLQYLSSACTSMSPSVRMCAYLRLIQQTYASPEKTNFASSSSHHTI